jgi:hypothetical protein
MVRFHCSGKHRAWHGRKAMRATLLSEGQADDLDLEVEISQRIAVKTDSGASKNTTIAFLCSLVPLPHNDHAEAEIWLEPEKPVLKEFSVFATFFRSFFTKLVPKHLLPSQTV